ncbi:MAG: PAS domain-containing protein [bacterium]|nr:PAS domain-containing protein [bacterium]
MELKIRLRIIKFCGCILFLICCGILFGSSGLKLQPQIKFEKVTAEAGGGSDDIKCILQDQKGFLWVGTSAGLLRYDGYRFKEYKHDPRVAVSLSNNDVYAIHEDRQGNLWVGTDGGLNKFNRQSEEFSHYLDNKFINTIYEDKKGVLWLGVYGAGLYKAVTAGGKVKFTNYTHEPGNPVSLSDDRVRAIYEDEKDIMWIGTDGGGLNRFDRKSGWFGHFKNTPREPAGLSDNHVVTIYGDGEGTLWLGTNSGLNKLLLDDVKVFDNGKVSAAFTRYKHERVNPLSLSHDRVHTIYKDSFGALWIGTRGGGLNKLVRENGREYFFRYQHQRNNPYSLSGNMVNAVYEDRSRVLWIGTYGNGLNKFNRRTGILRHYYSNPGVTGSLKHDVVLSIYEDCSGTVWVGTFGEGIACFDPETGTFTHYKHTCSDKIGIKCNMVLAIHEDHRGTLWLGTDGGGLGQFDRQSKRFTFSRNNKDDPHSLSNNTVRCIFKDSPGTLWFGTDNGLNRFNPQTGQFVHYKEKDGLPGNNVYGILEDNSGYLWLSTNKGLSRFDAKNEAFRNYDARDGTQHNKFNHGAYMKSGSGEMYFGGVAGLNVFNPSELVNNSNVPLIAITGVDIVDESFMQKTVTGIQPVVLDYQDYFITIKFSALDFTIPGKNQYRYQLEDFDNDWLSAETGNRTARYRNLDPGKYLFKVRGSNNDGTWNEAGTSVKIVIKHPYWQKWWFLTTAALVLIFLIAAGFHWRTRWLRKSRDAMERARDLAEFRNAENEKLIAAISSIFIAVDVDGKIFQWNESSEEFFGLPENEVKEKRFTDILKHYLPDDELSEIIRLGIQQHKPSTNVELHTQTGNDKEPRLLTANISPMVDRSGKTFGFLLLAEDITHRKKEEMLQSLSHKLEALGQMAAGIAHEIRSPLQYIGDNGRFLLEAFGGMIDYCRLVREALKKIAKSRDKNDMAHLEELMAHGDFDFYIEEVPQAAEQIVSGVTRVSNIVKSMNEFSYTGNEVGEKSDLNRLLKSTVVVAHNRIKKAADLETRYAPNLPLIPCGMGELNQVFLNLLINAADAVAETGKRGLIEIVTRQEGDELIAEISDNGIGIPDEIKQKIFTPFFTTKKVGQGTGQGLHFSYRIIVDRHKGKLYFKSKVNEGTTFYIHLPIDEE